MSDVNLQEIFEWLIVFIQVNTGVPGAPAALSLAPLCCCHSTPIWPHSPQMSPFSGSCHPEPMLGPPMTSALMSCKLDSGPLSRAGFSTFQNKPLGASPSTSPRDSHSGGQSLSYEAQSRYVRILMHVKD